MSELSMSLTPLEIPVHSRVLGNGMRVVVHPDRTAPIVAVHLMYHVGSKDERVGRTGLAHLLEHLLFEGSQNCAKGEFDRLLEAAGASNNGSTWLDRTNYYEVVPTHAVELALWLERERMAFFLPVLDEEMLELQRGVVINERRQAYENRPYGLADERLSQLLFPAEHPYSWPTIGYMPDLHEIQLQDARDFFQRYYTPRNSVLVLAGDVGVEDGFQLAERYFGDLPPGPEVQRAEAPALAAPAVREEVMRDRVSFARVYRAYQAPAYGSADWVTLDVLAYLLADGDSSRLQRALVRDGELAQDVDTYLYPTELAAVFGVIATARGGVEPRRLTAAIDAAVAEVAGGGVGEAELAGAVLRARRDQLAALANVEDRAEEIAYAATVLGSPEALQQRLDAYAAVTVKGVADAARRYLDAGSAVTLTVLPVEGEEVEDA